RDARALTNSQLMALRIRLQSFKNKILRRALSTYPEPFANNDKL
ncbi:MAG: hypothetical protein QG670_2472, partial [Thermoproteota archaeon]|nr:hypothetical protein [Thermoproteota archaeon]